MGVVGETFEKKNSYPKAGYEIYTSDVHAVEI